MHDPLLGVPACVIVTEEAVAEGSHEKHLPRVVACVPERCLRFEPGVILDMRSNKTDRLTV